ncbi:hypothetical protein Tco_1494616, partial [Tanacetum coccineum]
DCGGGGDQIMAVGVDLSWDMRKKSVRDT